MEIDIVKKIILALSLTAILASVALLHNGFTGSVQAQQSVSGTTKVAIVNVGLVFTKYEKAKFLKGELESTLKPFKDKGMEIAEEAKKYAKVLTENKNLDPKQKDDYEKYLLVLKRRMEDLDMDAKKLIGKKQEEQIVMLYKEVIGAIQGVAKNQGYHLVLGYGQQIEGDIYSFQNINRIMQGMDLGCATPLFITPVGVDISQDVVTTLNTYYRGNAGTPTQTVPGVTTSQQK